MLYYSADNKTPVIIISILVTDTFSETHLINVPFDLLSPACKKEEDRSLDRGGKDRQLVKCNWPTAGVCSQDTSL